MNLSVLTPKKALNKAYLKIKPHRNKIESFKTHLSTLLGRINKAETEEFHKNLVIDFLNSTYYKPNYYINTKGRNDLVIHNGKTAKASVGVIIEAKSPMNKAEMISLDNINKKAFQELVLYYLRERITHKNVEIKHLAATNINEWFIFNATIFDQFFAQNKTLVKQFNDFENGRLTGTKTEFFYKEIAAPFIDHLKSDIEFTYFNFQDYQKPLRSDSKTSLPAEATAQTDDNKLISLFKLLSPEHLLKLPFANDSNSLDKGFYSELLHIIGLTEVKEGNKKLIERSKGKDRNAGSIIENVITRLDSLDIIDRLNKPSRFGNHAEERQFNVALELTITWINRVLFLKLMEAQLLKYHNGNPDYAFLNFKKIGSYDDLNSLFFQVLAKPLKDRNEEVKNDFGKVPYLNSSLFESTDIEREALYIGMLKDDKMLPIHSRTVLKDQNGKKRKGEISTLQYFFEFLNAYDFSSEGSEEIQEENKPLINASVLGLIFEKINGYQDGSFFTPGFITMYMCRETIRKAVIQKFNETKDWHCESIEDIYDKIDDRNEANEIVNSLKICDPAVGSGHFLVSALNEIIAVKNDLKILQDREGKRLKEYQVEVVNDELVVTDEDSDLFEYRPPKSLTDRQAGSQKGNFAKPNESQRIQETLFHEKQTIIENCLFGVDINANSVKICRLRLWIELLKNAYYIQDGGFGYAQPPSSSGIEQPSDTGIEQPSDTGIEQPSDTGIEQPSNTGIEQPSNTGIERPSDTGIERSRNTGRTLQTLPNIDINIKCGNSLISRFNLDAGLKKALKNSKWTIDSYRMAVSSYRNAQNKDDKREMEKLILKIKQSFSTEIRLNDPTKKRLDKLANELYHRFTGTFLFEPEAPYGQSKKQLEKKRRAEQKKLEEEIDRLSHKIDKIKNNKIYENAFEWRFEFPEVLNDDGDFVGFDVVIANPPYVDLKELPSKIVRYLFDNFQTSKNRVNLYSSFIEKGSHLLQKNGYLSFIIPNSLLMNSSYQKLRDLIKNELYGIVKLPDNVFEDATVETIIVELQKNRIFESCETLAYKNDEKLTELDTSLKYQVPKNSWDIYDEPKFNIYISEEILKPLNKIHGKGKTLEDFAYFTLGITPYDKYKGHSQETIKNKAFHSDQKLSDEYKPLIKGSNIIPYYVDDTVNGFIKYGDWLGAPREEKFFTEPRVIVRQIVSGNPPKIYAGFTTKPLYFTQIGFAIIPKEYITVYGLTALLNSKVINFYHKYLFLDIEKELFQKILIQNCKKFPCLPFSNKTEIKNIVEAIGLRNAENPKSDTSELETQIDRLVYELYELTEEEIEIIENS